MTTPDGTKQARLSAETHRRLMGLAAELGGTADDALRHLLGLSTIRVPVTEAQRRRWIGQAQAAGVTVEQFVELRVEAAIQYGTDAAAIQQIWHGVNQLCAAAGLRHPAVNPQSTERRRLSIPNRPEEK
jgi:hypothetical protein